MTHDDRWKLGEQAYDLIRMPGSKYWQELEYSDQLRWVVMAVAIFALGVESVPC